MKRVFQFLAVGASLALAGSTATLFFHPGAGPASFVILSILILLCLIAAACAVAEKILPLYLISLVLPVCLISLGALIYFDVVLLAAAIGLHACRGATRRELAKYAIVILALVSLGAVVLYVIDSREQGGGTIKIDDLPFQR